MVQVQIGDNVNNRVCFYDSLDKELIEMGHDVLWLNLIQLYYISDNRSKKEWINSWIDKVKKFQPDIIFTFNNQISEEIIKVTDCPIILFEADLSEFFANTDLIKKYKDRYYAATFFEQGKKQYISLGFRDDRIIPLHPATSVKRENKPKIHNISFIGSSFWVDNEYVKKQFLPFERHSFYQMFRKFWESNDYDYEKLVNRYLGKNKLSVFDHYLIFDSRSYILQSVLDLGLKLYGVYWDKSVSQQLLPLVCAFDKTPMYSLRHNQDVYNSSKVNLSISHPQCRGYAHPWRIYDIMASGGALVSSVSEALADRTKGYVDIPMYHSPYDVRDLCKKLLKDTPFRQEVISASNEFIEKFGRWIDNFKTIQEYTGVKIAEPSNGEGSASIEYDLIRAKNIKARYKSFLYGILYAISNLPGIHSLQSEKYRKKIYNALVKYNKLLNKKEPTHDQIPRFTKDKQ